MTVRYRSNFIYGIATNVSGSLSQTTITGTNFPAIPSGTYLPIILNPGYYGTTSTAEIVYVTSVTSGVATLGSGRALEGTSVTSGTTVPWVGGPLVSDFGIANQMQNGDFPTPTASGQALIATGPGSGFPTWSNSYTINNGQVQYGVNTISVSPTYTLSGTDANNFVVMNANYGNVVVVPSGVFIPGQQINIVRFGTPTSVVISGGTGMTLVSTGATSSLPGLRVTYSVATVILLSSTQALVVGDIV